MTTTVEITLSDTHHQLKMIFIRMTHKN